MSNEHAADHRPEHEITIVVNGRKRTVTERELTFAQVVALAPDLPNGPNVIYTVTFKRGVSERPEGTLTEGETVKVHEGMIFNVSATLRS